MREANLHPQAMGGFCLNGQQRATPKYFLQLGVYGCSDQRANRIRRAAESI